MMCLVFIVLYFCGHLCCGLGNARNSTLLPSTTILSISNVLTSLQRLNRGSLSTLNVINEDATTAPGLVCDFCLYDGEGNFSSYDYPAPYSKNLDCTYRVKRVDESCHLEITFHEFDLQGVSDEACLNDYLLINGRRYCGTTWKGKTELVPFYPELEEVTFKFHTDDSVSGYGFWMEIKKQPNTCTLAAHETCNRAFAGEEFFIRSPKFPENYGNNEECLYSVSKHGNDVCGLEFTFLAFNIEPSDNCSYDYLEISGKRLCGTISPNAVRMFMFSEDETVITFNSDKQNTRAGFNVKVRQISKCYPDRRGALMSISSSSPSPPSCNIRNSAISGEIQSWGYPVGYANNLICQYSISKSESGFCSVELEFIDFDIDYTVGCTENIPFDISNTAIFIFQTDGLSTKKGFRAKFRQISCLSPAPNMFTAPYSSCRYIFDQKEFYLRSSNYPSNYSNNVDCQYVIRRLSDKICALEMKFNYFDLENAPNCRKDYLEIDGEKYCGKYSDSVIRTFPFQTVDKVISFHSDSSKTRQGFFLHVVQQECDLRSAQVANDECNQHIWDEEFEIRSPNYPEKYNNEVSCQYVIHRAGDSICDLALNIQDFRLQGSEVCESDYLQISEERLCGNIEAGSIRMFNFGADDEIVLSFETDSSINERGFMLSGVQRNCNMTDQPPFATTTTLTNKPVFGSSVKCDKIILEEEDVIFSPEYPANYPDGAECKYQIMRLAEKYCELEITINNLHIQVGDSCQFDYLEVDGHRFCGSTTAGNKRIFTFKSDDIVINFHSDESVNDGGFEVAVKQRECFSSTTEKPQAKVCNEVFDTEEFTITSPNFPSDYHNGLDCKYSIRRSNEQVCKLEMFFVLFDVESSSKCEYDFLSINEEKLCGVMENVTRTYKFEEVDKLMTFRTDSGTSRSGFMVQVRQLECPGFKPKPRLPLKPCNQQFSELSFELRSENYPSHYDPNLGCVYTIQKAHNHICDLEINFLAFDVEASDGCQYDYLEINNEKLCGVYPSNLKRMVKFNSSEITLKFNSDGATARPGFHLELNQIECSSLETPEGSCNRTFMNTSGVFSTPQYPHNYPGNSYCTYTFVAKSGYCRLFLEFLEFSLHTGDALCHQDYLEINRIRYCGPQLLGQTRTVTFYGTPREIPLIFSADNSIAEKGFYATFKQMPCTSALARFPKPQKHGKRNYVPSCDRLFASLKFQITSPNHPQNYPEDKNCRYTIRRLSQKICKLQLTFDSFDVESSENCEYDYLEVNGKRLCGTLPENTVRVFDIQDYQTIVSFQSDSANTRSGFIIKVEQLECRAKKPQPPEFTLPAKDSHPPLVVAEPPSDGESFIYPPHVVEEHVHLIDHPHFLPDYPTHPIVESNNHFDYKNCDRVFRKETFEIRSINFPGNYPNRVNCRYIIIKAHNDICWVKLTFIRFDVETSDDCQFDYLSINNKRICGTLPDDEIQAYIFTSDEISMYFRSDAATPHRGFLIKGEQLKCRPLTSLPKKPVMPATCDKYYDKDIFVIQSPSFPDFYPDSTDCEFTIKKVNKYICGLELTFLSFDVEDNRECGNDYVLAGDEKLCGSIASQTIRKIPFADAEMKISFHSNNAVSAAGFSILVKQYQDCENQARSVIIACDASYSAERFILNSPLFPDDYPSNLTCHYNIHKSAPSVCALELSVLSFDMEDKDKGRCDHDFLEFSDQNRVCGLLPKGYTVKLPFNRNELHLKFHSDSATERPGFSVQANQVTYCDNMKTPAPPETSPVPLFPCDQMFNSQEFSIRSPNFPNDYPHNVRCTYTIQPFSAEVCALELLFAHFDIEEGPECIYDYFDLGHKKICGALPSGFTRTVNFDSASRSFTFYSDKRNSKAGFAIKVRQLTDCGSTWKPVTPPSAMCDHCLKDNRGHITSPSYPDNYSDNLKCSYHIERAKGFCGLEIYFHDFHLEQSNNCSKDSLLVDGRKYCGTELKQLIKKIHFPIGEQNEIILLFETDSSESSTGFHAEYRQLPCRGYPWRPGRAMQSEETPSDWTPLNQSAVLPRPEELTAAKSDIQPLFLALNFTRYDDTKLKFIPKGRTRS